MFQHLVDKIKLPHYLIICCTEWLYIQYICLFVLQCREKYHKICFVPACKIHAASQSKKKKRTNKITIVILGLDMLLTPSHWNQRCVSCQRD